MIVKSIIAHTVLLMVLFITAWKSDFFKANIPFWTYGVLLMLMGMAHFLWNRFFKRREGTSVFFLLCYLGLFIHGVFLWRYDTTARDFNEQFVVNKLDLFDVEGTLEEIYGFKKKHHRFLLKVSRIQNGTMEYVPVRPIFANLYSREDISDIYVGDVLCVHRVHVLLTKNMPSEMEDYRDYLLNKQVAFSVFTEPYQVEYLKDDGNPLYRFKDLKDGWKDKMFETLPTEVYGLSKALILGDRTQLDDSLRDYFKNAGISHFIAISGLHIAILSFFIYFIFHFFFSRETAKAIMLYFILPIYLVMLAFNPPVFRTFIMIAMGVFLLKKHRPIHKNLHLVFPMFFISLIIQTLIIPNDIYSISFQLSFAATLGIFLALPILSKYRLKQPVLRYFLDFLVISLGAQLLTLPFILYYFHIFSPFALLYNYLIYPFIFVYLLLTLLLIALPSFFSPFISMGLQKTYQWMLQFFEYSSHYTFTYETPLNAEIMTLWTVVMFAFISLSLYGLKNKKVE